MGFLHQLKLDSFEFNEDETGDFVTLKHKINRNPVKWLLNLQQEDGRSHRKECMPLRTVPAAQSNFLLKTIKEGNFAF